MGGSAGWIGPAIPTQHDVMLRSYLSKPLLERRARHLRTDLHDESRPVVDGEVIELPEQICTMHHVIRQGARVLPPERMRRVDPDRKPSGSRKIGKRLGIQRRVLCIEATHNKA